MLSRLGNKALRVLDRPGRRAVLTLPGSLWVSWTYRTPCLVYWRNGAWIHHYRGAKIPHATLGRAAPPAVFTRDVRDLFLYEYTPRPGEIVFDAGAGTGAETLVFSRLVGADGRVVAIEAHPRTSKRLVDLCRANGLANVTSVGALLADFDGDAAISDDANHLRNARALDGIRVRARRLDSLADELEIDHIDLLKISAEGSEYEIVDHVLASGVRVGVLCVEFAQPAPIERAQSTIAATRAAGFELVRDFGMVTAAGWKLTFVAS